MANTKKIILRNLKIFEFFSVHSPDLEICHFYTAQNTENFVLIFYTHGNYIIIYNSVISKYFENSNCGFPKSSKMGSTEPVHQINALPYSLCICGNHKWSLSSMAAVFFKKKIKNGI
jgi:hypothetical protein